MNDDHAKDSGWRRPDAALRSYSVVPQEVTVGKIANNSTIVINGYNATGS